MLFRSEVGIDITGHKRQLLTANKLGGYDLIVNLAEKSQTPDWLRGENVIWWNVTHPCNESAEKNRIARDEIERRIKQLLNGEVVDDTQKPVDFDECERSYVGALLVDTNDKLITQQRDDRPRLYVIISVHISDHLTYKQIPFVFFYRLPVFKLK